MLEVRHDCDTLVSNYEIQHGSSANLCGDVDGTVLKMPVLLGERGVGVEVEERVME